MSQSREGRRTQVKIGLAAMLVVELFTFGALKHNEHDRSNQIKSERAKQLEKITPQIVRPEQSQFRLLAR
jgi:hypothetical protein